MKKLFAILLALMILFTLIACDEQGKPPSGEGNGTSQGGEDGRDTEPSSGNQNEGSDVGGGLSQAAMEAEILKRLSAISDLKSLTLCGGDKITYTSDGMIMAGDWWVIQNPDMSKDEFMASIEAQLTAAGFVSRKTFLGTEFTVKAGTGEIGISVMYEEGELTLRTTHFRDDYNAAYIAAENAKLPTIIEGVDIIDKLPENFSVGFKDASYRYVVCRYNGGYYVESESIGEESADYHFVHYYAAIPQDDGSYRYYYWSDMTKLYNNTFEAGTPEERNYFMSSGDETVQDQVNEQLEKLSTWIRMCWEYKDLPIDEDRFFWSMTEYSISENMTKVGSEIYLGRSCEQVHSEGLWADTYDLLYDLETGMVMKMTVQDGGQGDVVTFVEVTEYNTAPASLGKFVQP